MWISLSPTRELASWIISPQRCHEEAPSPQLLLKTRKKIINFNPLPERLSATTVFWGHPASSNGWSMAHDGPLRRVLHSPKSGPPDDDDPLHFSALGPKATPIVVTPSSMGKPIFGESLGGFLDYETCFCFTGYSRYSLLCNCCPFAKLFTWCFQECLHQTQPLQTPDQWSCFKNQIPTLSFSSICINCIKGQQLYIEDQCIL